MRNAVLVKHAHFQLTYIMPKIFYIHEFLIKLLMLRYKH